MGAKVCEELDLPLHVAIGQEVLVDRKQLVEICSCGVDGGVEDHGCAVRMFRSGMGIKYNEERFAGRCDLETGDDLGRASDDGCCGRLDARQVSGMIVRWQGFVSMQDGFSQQETLEMFIRGFRILGGEQFEGRLEDGRLIDHFDLQVRLALPLGTYRRYFLHICGVGM